MQSFTNRLCKVGVLVVTVLAILALCFGALSLGFRHDAPFAVQVLVMGLGLLVVASAVVACWCRLQKKRFG
jgi:hypothetical protein